MLWERGSQIGSVVMISFFLAGWGVLTGCTPAGPRALLSGERLIREEKYPQAIIKLETATHLLPGNAQAWNHLGLAYHKAGHSAEALKAYQQALRTDPNLNPVHYNLGCLMLEQDNPQSAAAELTTFTLLQPDSVPGWLKLGTAQLRSRQGEAAERSFQAALRLQPDLAEAWNGVGLAQLQHKRTREAVNCFSAALQKQSNYPPALLNLAIVYQNYLNNRALALEKYEEYANLVPAPSKAAAVQDVARHLRAELNPPPPLRPELTNVTTGLSAEAIPARSNNPVANGPSAIPPSSRISTNLANAPLSTTNRTRAGPKSQLTPSDLSPHNPKLPPDLQKRLEIVSRVGSTLRAEGPASNSLPRTAANAQDGTPRAPAETSSPVESIRREATLQSATPVEVVRVADEALPKTAQDQSKSNAENENSPSTARTSPLNQASALLARNIDEAPRQAAVPEKKRVLDKLNPASWFRGKRRPPNNSGIEPLPDEQADPGSQLLASSGHLSESAALAPLAIPRYKYRSPHKPAAGSRAKADPYFTEAVVAHRNGRLDDAVDAYRKATKFDPSFFEAQYNLGLAAYTLKDLPLSLSAYETALAINPASSNARYNFALALQQDGYFEDAAKELETLIERSPGEARAHFSAASLYAEKLGQPSLARPHYRKVLELEPQHPQALAIRYWLAANP